MAEKEQNITLTKEEFDRQFDKGTAKRLGRGSYGYVEECLWNGEEAVVKVITDFKESERTGIDHIEATCREWKKLEHKNIIQFQTSKSDIWSFSLVQLFMLTASDPVPNPILAAMDFQRGWRPEIPDWCPPMIEDIITECWKEDPEERPNASALIEDFQKLEELLKDQLDVPIRELGNLCFSYVFCS